MRTRKTVGPGMSARALLAWGLLGVLACVACGDDETPVLHALRYDGQAPDSELVLLFTARFSDPDGDLGEGFLETFIQGRPSGLGRLPLRPIFLWNELPLQATEGELEFHLELALASSFDVATTFELGVRAVDDAGNASELRTVRLEVTPR